MPNFTLSEKQLTEIQHILSCDNAQLADQPEFFEETGLDPNVFITERIALCNAFKIDFWNTVGFYSTTYNTKRLKALYTGQSIKEFEKQHKRPDHTDIA